VSPRIKLYLTLFYFLWT